MCSDGRRVTLPLARDGERLELVDAGGEFEIADGALAGANHDGGAGGIEPEVGGDDFVGAGREVGQKEVAGVVSERGEVKRGDFDLGPGEEIAGGDIVDDAGERAGGGRRGEGAGSGERGGGEEAEEDRAHGEMRYQIPDFGFESRAATRRRDSVTSASVTR